MNMITEPEVETLKPGTLKSQFSPGGAGSLPDSSSEALMHDRMPAGQNIRREITGDGICVLTFDRPGSSANVFDAATLIELNEHLDFITAEPSLKGLVLTSAKPAIFIAGADLHALSRMPAPDVVHFIELGQTIFHRLATLCVPTVAAVHGACVGGGYEVCLACNYRIASMDRVTKIGLPETQLGLIPAWGGSTRLPRLIGLPRALDVILAGKTLAAAPALKAGMVDELAPKERLLELAFRKILSEGQRLRRRRGRFRVWAVNNAIAATVIATRAQSQVMRRTRGHYPAVLKALDVAAQGVTRPIHESLSLERDAMSDLAQSEVCRNLVRMFFLTERAKKLSIDETATMRSSSETHESSPADDGTAPQIRRAAVIGAGVMGAGIAQWLSGRGLEVILQDIDAGQVNKGMLAIRRLYEQGVKRHHFTRVEARAGADRIFPSVGEVPLGKADIIIEAAAEHMELKKGIFNRLDELAGPGAVLATNTSALSISELAQATRRPERVVGIHFFNPVHRMPLVEVVVGRQTSPEVARRAVRFVQQIGKLPVVVSDSPGFLVNRILVPYLIEAGHLFEAGAHIADIDEAMLEFGMPMGPLRLMDEVGLDVARHVAETLAAGFGERMFVPPLLSRMIEAGLLGRKSEHGFYRYQEKTPRPSAELRMYRTGNETKSMGGEELQNRMVLPMVNEAARCLEERVVASAEDVDFAMIMGAGFAPFRGGPLRYADSAGLDIIVEVLNHLAASDGPRFKPCALLARMAAQGEKFHPERGGKP